MIQYSFLPPTGAPDDVLLINFKRPHALFRSGPGFAQAWELGRRGAHLFIVLPLPGPLRKVKHLPVQNGPRKEFVRLAERRYVGFWNILVGDYVLRPGVGHG